MRPSASLPTGERQLHPVVLADQLERDSLRVSELPRQIPKVDRVHGSVLEVVLKVCQSSPAVQPIGGDGAGLISPAAFPGRTVLSSARRSQTPRPVSMFHHCRPCAYRPQQEQYSRLIRCSLMAHRLSSRPAAIRWRAPVARPGDARPTRLRRDPRQRCRNTARAPQLQLVRSSPSRDRIGPSGFGGLVDFVTSFARVRAFRGRSREPTS